MSTCAMQPQLAWTHTPSKVAFGGDIAERLFNSEKKPELTLTWPSAPAPSLQLPDCY